MNTDILNCLISFSTKNNDLDDEILLTIGILLNYKNKDFKSANNMFNCIKKKKDYMYNMIGLNFSEIGNKEESENNYMLAKDNSFALGNLAILYLSIENYDLMFYFCRKSIDNSNLLAYKVLSNYYKKFGYYNLALNYLIKLFDSGNIEHSINSILEILEIVDDEELLIKVGYYGLERKNKGCIRFLYNFFSKKKNKNTIIKILEYAILECKYNEFIYDISDYYFNIGDYYNMKSYLLKGISDNDNICMISLGNYYFDNNHYLEAEKYYLMALDNYNHQVPIILYKFYKILKNNHLSKTCLQKGLKRGNFDCLVYMGLEYYDEGKISTAIDIFIVYLDILKENNLKLKIKEEIILQMSYCYNKFERILNSSFECPIKLETVTEGFKLKCGHMFSNEIFMTYKNECPCCRRKFF